MRRSAHSLTRRDLLKTASVPAIVGVTTGCMGDGDETEPSGNTDPTDQQTEQQETETADLEQRAIDEGQLKVATTITGIEEYFDQFQNDTGIEVEVVRGTPPDLIPRISQEASANRQSFDVVMGATAKWWYDLFEDDLLQQIPDSIADQWPETMTLDGYMTSPYFLFPLGLLYNPDVTDSPPTTLDGLLADEWAGEVTFDVRERLMLLMLRDVYGEEEGEDLVRQIGEVATWRESRFSAAQEIANGSVPMGVTFLKYQDYDFGDSLEEQPLDGLPTMVKEQNNTMLQDAPHPNAAEYLLTYHNERAGEYFEENATRLLDREDILDNDEYYPVDIGTLEDVNVDELDAEWLDLIGQT